MKELFYFSFADLMARIEYQQEANSLRYATHRKITLSERVVVEQYLLNTVAVKTEYYKHRPAYFVSLGTDPQLTKALEQFHSKNTLRTRSRMRKRSLLWFAASFAGPCKIIILSRSARRL